MGTLELGRSWVIFYVGYGIDLSNWKGVNVSSLFAIGSRLHVYPQVSQKTGSLALRTGFSPENSSSFGVIDAVSKISPQVNS
jgi:hypothetical protein